MRIRERRIELGLKQRDVARQIRKVDARIDACMLSKFENGVCLPTPAVREALCDILKASDAELFGDAEQRERERSEYTALIARIIPFGKENAISRKRLREELGCDDNLARKRIRQARLDGLVIINDQDGCGYYRTEDKEAISRQLKQVHNRAMTLLAQEKFLREQLKEEAV